MSNQTKDAARERAFEAYMQCEHDIEKPNYSGPISVCDVCRGRFSEESFYAGYDAALARTCTWTWVEDASHPFASAYSRGCDGLFAQDVPERCCGNCGGRVVQEESNEQ